MKVAYVTVRYGPDIRGGAEQACRSYAEHLAADGVAVEVHTTCATDATTWADSLPAGRTVEAGVTVHRYPVLSGRAAGFERFSGPVLADPARQTAQDQERWVDLQGPVCPAAVEGAAASGADLVLATPYLYWPAIHLARAVPDRFVLHPAAHDEAPIRLPVFGDLFAAARGLAFYTDAERRLVERLWPSLGATPQLVAGLGMDPVPATDGSRFRAAVAAGSAGAIGDRPYVLYLGRVDEGKGTAALARFFTAYKRRRPGPLALVLAGPVVHTPPQDPDVVVTGPLSEDDKRSAFAGAEVFVNPSANESFSIALLEAWAAGVPAMVNARCGATAEHARRSRAGLAYGGYAAFETGLDRLLADGRLRRAMGAAGRGYVEDLFAWPAVTARYRTWLERLADGSPVRSARSTSLVES